MSILTNLSKFAIFTETIYIFLFLITVFLITVYQYVYHHLFGQNFSLSNSHLGCEKSYITRTVSHRPLTEYSIVLHIRLFVYTSQIVNTLVASFYHAMSKCKFAEYHNMIFSTAGETLEVLKLCDYIIYRHLIFNMFGLITTGLLVTGIKAHFKVRRSFDCAVCERT